MSMNYILKYCFAIFCCLTLTPYSVMAVADLKENLIELGQTSDPNKIENLLEVILNSPDFVSLDKLGLSVEHLDTIFGALLKTKSDNAQKLFFKLLEAPFSWNGWWKGLFKNAMLLIADYVSQFDSLPEEVRKWLKIKDNQLSIGMIFRNSFEHSVDAQDLKSLMTVLEWDDFNQDIKNMLLDKLPKEKLDGLFGTVLKTNPDNPGKLFFNLLDAVKGASGFFKNAMLAIAHYVGQINSLSEEARESLKSKKYQTIIENIFISSLKYPVDAQDIKSFMTVLSWKDIDQQYRKLILYDLVHTMKSGSESSDKEIEQQILTSILPYLYKSDLEQFSKMVFSVQPERWAAGDEALPSAEPSKVICNQEGYDEGVSIICEKGQALKLDAQTPIGYNIHLPQGDVKAIFTHIYGGFQATTRKENMFLPGALDALDKYLLANGIAIIKLNLLDLRELQDFQASMPEDIDRRQHESINKYFEVFKDPQLLKKLHPELLALQGKPNFLFGASFGGRTALMHAQRFPRTFKAYISFDGGLDFKVMDLTNAAIAVQQSWSLVESQKWLDPINEAEKIQDPVLLLHNLDDNTVSAAVSIAFYQKAIQKKKELTRLLRLLLTNRGNPIPADEEKIYYKGHFLPREPESMKRLGATVLEFMLRGPSSLPAASELSAQVHKWRGYEINTFHGIRFALPQYLWLSELFRHYYALKQPKITDELWSNEFLPIFQSIFLALNHYTAKQAGELSFIEELTKADKDNFADQCFANAISRHAQDFADFLIEKYSWKVDSAGLTKLIINDENIRHIFKLWIVSPQDSNLSLPFNNYLFYEFFRANPSIAKEFIGILLNNIKYESQEAVKTSINKLKTAFESSINQSEALAKLTWQQVISTFIVQRRAEDLKKFYESATELSTLKPLDSSQIVAQFKDLLALADPWLGKLAYNLDIRTSYRKLLERYEPCQTMDCAPYRALSLLSFGLLMGEKDFMKESVLKAAHALKALYPNEKNLGEKVVKEYLAPLLAKLSQENRRFSPQELLEFIGLIDKQLGH